MSAPDIDPILVAADWLPRLPNGARGMVVTLMAALDRERRAHACTLSELAWERGRDRRAPEPEPVSFAPRLVSVDGEESPSASPLDALDEPATDDEVDPPEVTP